MAATHVQARAKEDNILAFSSNVTAGNLLVVCYGATNEVSTATATDTVGTTYTRIEYTSGHTVNCVVLAGIAAASGANTVTVGSVGISFASLTIDEFSGVSLPQNASANSYNASSPATVNITTTAAESLLFAGVHGPGFGNSVYAAGSGFTLGAQQNTFAGCASEYQLSAASGAHTATMTVTSGAANDTPMVAVAFPITGTLQLLAGNPATAVTLIGYSQAIALTTGGTAPLAFSITAGTLPAGLNLATNGTLSGTPTAAGNSSVTVQVVDAGSATVSGSYTVHVSTTGDIGPHDMTSDTSHVPFVASASGETRGAWNAFTPLYAPGSTNRWTQDGSTTGYLQLDVGAEWSEHVIAYVVRASYNNFELGSTPKNWTMQGSRDGVTFTTFSTVTNQTGWVVSEARRYTCESTVGYRYLRMAISAVNGDVNMIVGRLSFYRPGPHENTPIVGLTMVVWHSYTWADFQANAFLYLGSPGNTPGSIFSPGQTVMYLDGTIIPKTALAYRVDLNSDLTQVGVTISSDGLNVSAPDTVVWASVYGSTLGNGLNEQFVYGVYFRAYFADGSHRYSFPAVSEIELFTTGGVDDPDLAIDSSLDTASRVWRDFFSPLSTPAFLRISAFGAFEDVTPSCNNPPNGTVGIAYGHAFTVTGGLAPYVWSVIGGVLPPGLVLADSGIESGIPTDAGTYPFTLQVTSDVFSLTIPYEETTTYTVNCSEAIAAAGPCPPGTGSQTGPG